MKTSKFSDAQKAFILNQGSDGILWRTSAARRGSATQLKKRHDGLLPTDTRRLKLQEYQNADLFKLSRRSRRNLS